MLRFDLAELIRTPGMRQVLDFNEPPYDDDDIEFLSPVVGRVIATNTGTMLLIHGKFETTVAESCSRCLEDLRLPVEGEIEEDYDLKVIDDPSHHDKVVQVVSEDGSEDAFEGKTLKVDVLVRQASLLAVPLQPLCREECPGIAVEINEIQENEVKENSPFHILSQIIDQTEE